MRRNAERRLPPACHYSKLEYVVTSPLCGIHSTQHGYPSSDLLRNNLVML